jgi:hypothetical protein
MKPNYCTRRNPTVKLTIELSPAAVARLRREYDAAQAAPHVPFATWAALRLVRLAESEVR